MPRLPRFILPGFAHHVTQRGVKRGDLFFEQEDRTFYLQRFSELAVSYNVEVLAYVLMSNHVHFLVVPSDKRGLAKVFGILHAEYAHRINSRFGWSGHLFQSRFYSCAVATSRIADVIAYIELNPVRAKMVRTAQDHPWSSALSRLLNLPDPLLTKDPKWIQLLERITKHWPEFLQQQITADNREVRKLTRIGRPLGPQTFIDEIAERFGKRVSSGILGRPRKAKNSN